MCQSKDQGGRRCAGAAARAAATVMVPRRGALREYYAATDAKHFTDPFSAGSKFTGLKVRRLNDVVMLAWRQRDGLEGDDRGRLVALGADPAVFMPGVRYLLVKTPGTVGVVRSEGMPGTTPVDVVRMKPGAACSLVVDVDTRPPVAFGTVVIGPARDDPDREVVWTAHPGLPAAAGTEDLMGAHEGRTVTLDQVRRVYGGDLTLNARLR